MGLPAWSFGSLSSAIAAPLGGFYIPPHTWHEVTSAPGGQLLTIFSPGGFEGYLAEMAGLAPEQFADESFMTGLAEKYDSWTR